MEQKKIEEQCHSLLCELENQCNDKIKEIVREISSELKFTTAFSEDSSLKMHNIIDGKRIWNWSSLIVGGGLSIGAGIAYLAGAAFAGPLGWVALGVSVVGIIGSFLFKDRDKKEHEARVKLEKHLKKNVDELCEKLEKQMSEQFSSMVSKKIGTLLSELDKLDSIVFKLADTQKELAWKLNTRLKDINKQLLTEVLILVGADGLQYHIQSVARIPGSSICLVVGEQTVFPKEQELLITELLNEHISYIHYTENTWLLLGRIMGKTVERSKIRLEERINVAHIPYNNETINLIKVRLAQQIAEVVITNDRGVE